jgi:peptide-methionine (S)-S-oxide reductase
LEVFFRGHDATEKPWMRQYMSAIFYHSEEQKQLTLAFIAREEVRLPKGKIYTEVLPASTFYPAEDYHQKFYLKFEDDLVAELRAMYPDFNEYIRSTAVARINGFIRGYGDVEVLRQELPEYGLSDEAGKKLLKLATE